MSKPIPYKYGRVEQIFLRKWRASVPMIATMNETWLSTNGGRYVSGSAYWDERINNQWRESYLTISDMVDYQRQGVVVAVKYERDTKQIYDIIQSYLLYAAELFQRMYDPGAFSDTLEDLRDLDRLATTVYAHAKFHEPPEVAASSFIQQLRSFGAFHQPLATPTEAVRERQRSDLAGLFIQMLDPERIDAPAKPKDPFADMEPV